MSVCNLQLFLRIKSRTKILITVFFFRSMHTLFFSLFFIQVSWIRREDYHLLTVGLTTYSSDDRFLVEHARHLQSWGLQIKFVTPNDAGVYECQISTHPPTSIFVRLKVIGKKFFFEKKKEENKCFTMHGVNESMRE